MDFDRERNEAINAGRAALASLEEAKRMLSSARNWGIYDTFFKGGWISGLIKHSRMSSAEEKIYLAESNLRRFNEELHDLNLMGINLDTGDLLGIADILFDGFLSEILMQNRIREARVRVDQAISSVQSLISQLEKL